MHHFRDRIVAVAFMVALAVMFAGGSMLTRAQDATPVSGEAAGVSHPAHIHEGTCDDLNPQPVFPLADVQIRAGLDLDTASPVASPLAPSGGVPSAVPAAVSVTTVNASLETILATDHSINVHESAENIQNYIACGEIGGTADSDGNLFIGLSEVNDSGHTGVAWLQANGEQTIVTIFLAEGLAGEDGGTGAGAVSSPAA
jgi:hypothetical protein